MSTTITIQLLDEKSNIIDTVYNTYLEDIIIYIYYLTGINANKPAILNKDFSIKLKFKNTNYKPERHLDHSISCDLLFLSNSYDILYIIITTCWNKINEN